MLSRVLTKYCLGLLTYVFPVSFPPAPRIPKTAGCGSQEAINCYRTTLRLKPDHPHAYNNLGNAMKDKVWTHPPTHTPTRSIAYSVVFL